jgi:hypothetical protein
MAECDSTHCSATMGKHKWENSTSVSPRIKQDLISKITNAKTAGGATQVVELLPGKCEILSSMLQYCKKGKKIRPFQFTENPSQARLHRIGTFFIWLIY